MEKKQKIIDTLKPLVKEREEAKAKINELPKGYIQFKTVSGHKYAFRQWRDGDKIKSEYVNANYVSLLEKKIQMRKAYQQLLKDINREIKKISLNAIKKGIITSEEVEEIIG